MITNAMFFTPQDEDIISPDTVRIGAFRLSLKTAYVSVVGAVITVVPTFLITHLFRTAKNKQIKQNKKTSKNSKNRSDVSEMKLDDNIKKYCDVGVLNDSGKTEVINTEIKLINKGKLPHWVIYIAWTILTLAIVTSAFFMLLYSMEWGKKTSEEWLTSFVLSFFESILVVDPLKVSVLKPLFYRHS